MTKIQFHAFCYCLVRKNAKPSKKIQNSIASRVRCYIRAYLTPYTAAQIFRMLHTLRCVGWDEYATSAYIGEGGDNDIIVFLSVELLHSCRDLLAVQCTRRSLCTDRHAGVTWADKARGEKTGCSFHSLFNSLCITKVCKQQNVKSETFFWKSYLLCNYVSPLMTWGLRIIMYKTWCFQRKCAKCVASQ